MIEKTLHLTYKAARRIVVAVVGITILAIGLIMIVTPGPALVVIPVGLAVLGIEFAWARSWLRRIRETLSDNFAKNFAERAEAHRDRVRD